MRFIITFVLMMWLAGCTVNDTPSVNRYALVDGSEVTVTIEKLGDGRWQANYVFATPQTAMILSRSHNDYRVKSWKSLDANVRFERIKGFDALLFEKPANTASFIFSPFTGTVRRDYTPFIPFSDGGMAVYTGQFEVLSVKNRAEIEDLNGSLNNWRGAQGLTAIRISSDENMIHNGNVLTGEVIDITKGGGQYIYVGNAKITQGIDFTGVIDPGLPKWLHSRFDSDLSKIYNGHRELWGERLTQKSTVYFAFRGYEGRGFSNKGGALGSMLALEALGEDLKHENEEVLQNLHWFFAHEVAHLFQNKGAQKIGNNHADSWITEGSANAMANNVLRHKKLANAQYFIDEYADEFSQCTTYLKTGKLLDAVTNGQYDIPYACGDIMAQITDASLPDQSLFDFWNIMIADFAGEEEKEYTTTKYLATMSKLGAADNIVIGIKKLATQKIDNPVEFLSTLMVDCGLDPKFDESGQLISLKLP